MGYFNIIESLSDTRNNKEVVNEATSILQDYKSVFSQLEKALLSCKDTTLHGDWTFLLYLCVGSMTHVRVLPVFDVNKLHQKEDTKKERVVYHTISDVVDKGYTSNSGSDLVLPILSKDRFRINLSDDKKSWVETRYPR